MAVTIETIRLALRDLGLSGRVICVHASLRSFGDVIGGGVTIVDGILAEGCTVLVPSFSWDTFAIPPPSGMRPPRNGWQYDASLDTAGGASRVFAPGTGDVDRDMGAIPATVVAVPGRARGDHPLCSFSAVGPRASELVMNQRPLDVYAPLRTLVEMDGAVVCMGVGLTRMTLLHLAEQQAGRTLFRRWANGPQGRPMIVETGGCSEGFDRLDGILAPVERRTMVGESSWRVFPAAESLRLAGDAIRSDPEITRCTDPTCGRCNDAVLGGPLMASEYVE
jgi:aminoglycoside 3-N-acetyltransferase